MEGTPQNSRVQAAFQPAKSTKPHTMWTGVLWMDQPQDFPASGQTDEAGSITSTTGEQHGQGWGASATAPLALINDQADLLTPPPGPPLYFSS